MHLYRRSRYSNAGNCECGWHFHHSVHPHPFTQRLAGPPGTCVCGLVKEVHTAVHEQGCLGMHWGDCEVSGHFS